MEISEKAGRKQKHFHARQRLSKAASEILKTQHFSIFSTVL